MPYIEMMESGLRQVVRAGEEGRRSVDGMLVREGEKYLGGGARKIEI